MTRSMTGKLSKKQPIEDQMMIELMHHLIANKMDDVDSQASFAERLGMSRQGINSVIAGERSFTMKQVRRASEIWGIDMNWLIGRKVNMHYQPDSKSTIERLREAVTAIEIELKESNTKRRVVKSKV